MRPRPVRELARSGASAVSCTKATKPCADARWQPPTPARACQHVFFFSRRTFRAINTRSQYVPVHLRAMGLHGVPAAQQAPRQLGTGGHASCRTSCKGGAWGFRDYFCGRILHKNKHIQHQVPSSATGQMSLAMNDTQGNFSPTSPWLRAGRYPSRVAASVFRSHA